MVREFLFLSRVKRQLVEQTLPNTQAFVYFFIITAVDNLQLGLLQVSPAQPTRWTSSAVWGSLGAGGVFLVATYLLNGGSGGRDYLIRHFSISAVVALWVALPLQLLISLPRIVAPLANLDWYVLLFCSLRTSSYFPSSRCKSETSQVARDPRPRDVRRPTSR